MIVPIKIRSRKTGKVRNATTEDMEAISHAFDPKFVPCHNCKKTMNSSGDLTLEEDESKRTVHSYDFDTSEQLYFCSQACYDQWLNWKIQEDRIRK
jgi:hypothetical protein